VPKAAPSFEAPTPGLRRSGEVSHPTPKVGAFAPVSRQRLTRVGLALLPKPLYGAPEATGLPIEASSGGRTKFNRSRFGIPKPHVLEAACVGEAGTLVGWQIPSMEIKASGRGDYCRTKFTAHGFPRGYCMRTKSVGGFKTGDMVRAEVPNGKKVFHLV
jgi:hypothetical protein